MGKVFGITELELLPGVSADEFERFMREEGANLPVPPGQRLYFLKGDRGARAGKYAWLVEFESPEARDRFFPRDDELSEEAQQYFGSEQIQQFFARWGTFNTTSGAGTVWTDYMSVTIGR